MASTKTEADTLPPQKYGQIVLTLENVLLPPEKLSPSPSRADGLDAETEFDLRVMGCEMIQTSGILLRLPQVRLIKWGLRYRQLSVQYHVNLVTSELIIFKCNLLYFHF